MGYPINPNIRFSVDYAYDAVGNLRKKTDYSANSIHYIDGLYEINLEANRQRSFIGDSTLLNWNPDDGYQLLFTLKDHLGGIIGAIRNTKQTGNLVGGPDHIQKGRDILGKLRKVRNRINNSHGMSDSERSSMINTVLNDCEKIIDTDGPFKWILRSV